MNRNSNLKEYFFIGNLKELEGFAKWVVSLLSSGFFLSISGDLGVGKTTLTQFLCSELGVKERITSPTFTILKSYWSEKKNCFVNHFDFFRIISEDDIEAFSDLRDGAINIVEWPEKAPSFFNKSETIRIRISFWQAGRKVEILYDPLKSH